MLSSASLDACRGSAGTSSSSPSSPRCVDELASSTATDRTFVVANRSLTRPPSPSPLLYVSVRVPSPVPLTLPSADGSVRGAVATAKCAARSCKCAGGGDAASVAHRPIACDVDAERWSCVVPHRSCPEPVKASDADEDDPHDSACHSRSRSTSGSGSSSSSGVSRCAEDWCVLWTHVFPMHIAGYLCMRDVTEVAQVCRTAYGALQQPWVWRSLAVHHHHVQAAALEHTFLLAAQQWEPETPTEATQRWGVSSPPRGVVDGREDSDYHHHHHHHHRDSLRRRTALLHSLSADDGRHTRADEVLATAINLVSSDDDGDDGVEGLEVARSPRRAGVDGPLSAPSPASAVVAEAAVTTPEGRRVASPTAPTAAAVAARAWRPVQPLGSSASSSRFLWQTTTAAMPSPSSPVSTPPPDDDDDDDDVPLAGASPHPTALMPPAATSPSGPERTSGDKGGALRWAAAPACLPPPSPAQVESSVVGAETSADGEVHPWASFTSGSLRRHPLSVMESAAEVDEAVTAPRPPAARSGATCHPTAPAAAAHAFVLCRATAERSVLRSAPVFPWRAFSQYLHAHRVHRSLAQLTALSRVARAELCRGGGWDAAYGALSHAVHVLCQTGGCRGVEHLRHLASTLVRRASLCRHRGHVSLFAAVADLSVAGMLCPDTVAPSELSELCGRDELAHESPASWLRRWGDAAHVASPVALLGIVAQVPALFPQDRRMSLCSALTFYVRARRMLRQSLTHLLHRAAELAAPGTGEGLLVQALREVAAAQHTGDTASAHAACATADYALTLLPQHVRDAAERLTAAWVRDCLPHGTMSSAADITRWADVAPEALEYSRTTPLEVRWVAWLTVEVRWFAYEELLGALPGQTALLSLVLGCTAQCRADGLVRLSMQYANADVKCEDLRPALPHGACRGHLAQSLLESALRLRPLHPTAALLLSRMHARDAEGVGHAIAVLTECIHTWAQRFPLLEMRGAADAKGAVAPTGQQPRRPARDDGAATAAAVVHHLHRRERRPEVCFVPSELLVERSRCLCTIADLAEATEQHPTLSYPYQMRAAMAMDRGYHLAAITELSRILTLTLDPSDVALRVRFLRDAAAMSAGRLNDAEESAGAVAVAAAGVVDLSSAATVAAVSDTDSLRSSAGDVAPPADASGPLFLSSPQLAPLYHGWMATTMGLLTLLHPREPPRRGSGREPRRRFVSREWLATRSSAGTPAPAEGHVSRVASVAFSDGEEDEALVRSACDELDAAHVCAFLKELLSPSTLSAPAPPLPFPH